MAGVVGTLPVGSWLLSNLSSCCFVLNIGGFAGISLSKFLMWTRMWYSLDHLKRIGNTCSLFYIRIMAWYGMVWYGMVSYRMVSYRIVWYRIVSYRMP